MAFKGEVLKHFVVSDDRAEEFMEHTKKCIQECGELYAEVQYQPVMQRNGKLLFTAYIIGRSREDD